MTIARSSSTATIHGAGREADGRHCHCGVEITLIAYSDERVQRLLADLLVPVLALDQEALDRAIGAGRGYVQLMLGSAALGPQLGVVRDVLPPEARENERREPLVGRSRLVRGEPEEASVEIVCGAHDLIVLRPLERLGRSVHRAVVLIDLQRYLQVMLIRVQELAHTDTQHYAVALTERSGRELVPISSQKAWEIHVEFEREWPRIEAAADAGFPVPDSIPFEIDDPQ